MNDTLPKSTTPAPTGSMAKETGPHIGIAEAPLVQEVGQEISLPNEVVKAGVTIKPTTINIPPSIKQMGVSDVGTSTTATVGVSSPAPLPLSDEQIAKGLHESIKSSLRWLAQWCERQLKQAHVMLKSIHGKITRMNG